MLEITPSQQSQLDHIGRAYEVKLILLHGSYAANTQRVGSDFDIAVLERKPMDHKVFLEFSADMAKVFGNGPERELDIKTLRHADPLFLYHVAKKCRLLYGDLHTFSDFRAHAFVLYMDSKDLRNLEGILVAKYQKTLNQKYAR